MSELKVGVAKRTVLNDLDVLITVEFDDGTVFTDVVAICRHTGSDSSLDMDRVKVQRLGEPGCRACALEQRLKELEAATPAGG